MPNRLAKETSPYLLQHKDNPVDWYAWGEEALARAKAENKPILLSIGYSACHWCHVMEHESFENEEIARLMNERFINIKVDREERPDLDQIYQNVAQAMTRSGGWPLTVFLTPDLKPYFGGTYFPPEDRWGRPGFPRVLTSLASAFREDPAGVAENSGKLMDFISTVQKIESSAEAKLPDWHSLVESCQSLLADVDWRHGGFGGAPKFPNATSLTFLWRMGGFLGDTNPGPQAREAVLLSLDRMASRGIYDQLGGGFHRYSVDEYWSVPHFEKMLYDNGGLLKLYSEVLMSRHPDLSPEREALFIRVIRETVQYVIREMRSPEGAFYSAQDADSEGEEGKFFVWDLEDLSRYLTEEEAKLFALRYGITREGNFEHSGKTVLFQAFSEEQVAEKSGVSIAKAREGLKSASAKLFQARSARVAPSTDTKQLASWNGLMISGLAFAARALELKGEKEVSKEALIAADHAFEFLSKTLVRPEGRLWSSYKDGKARFNAYLDDYAFLAAAALDLSRAQLDSGRLGLRIAQARQWIDVVLKYFKDPESAGYFFTSSDHESLIHRPKTIYDQAIPSGTGVVLGCLSVISELFPDSGRYTGELEQQLGAIYPTLARNPHGYSELLCASLLAFKGPIAVSGEGFFFEHPHVFRKEGRALQLCHRGTCSLPAKDLSELQSQLHERMGH